MKIDRLLHRRGVLSRRVARLDCAILVLQLGQACAGRPNAWTAREKAFLERNFQALTHAQIGLGLGRTTVSIKTFANRVGLVMRSHWSDAELQVLQDRHAEGDTPTQMLRHLPGRTLLSIYQARNKLGLAAKKRNLAAQLDPFIRQYHAEQFSDAEIEQEWNRRRAGELGTVTRSFISQRRRVIGLPQNGVYTERFSRRVAAKTREQLAKAGLPSIGYLRAEAFKKFARESGWPEDLPPRAVQMLNAIWERGPMTRRELADVIGMPWKGSRKSLTAANHPGGSYLALLIRRGMVIKFRKVVRSRYCGMGNRAGQGKNTDLYSLSLDIQRQAPATKPKGQDDVGIERQWEGRADEANPCDRGIATRDVDGSAALAPEHARGDGQFNQGRGSDGDHAGTG